MIIQQEEEMVSIHTPLWGVTVVPILASFVVGVSIHTPLWGVTFDEFRAHIAEVFQSTPPCGG